MVSSSRIENLALRHAPYVDELRDFFRSRKVPFGSAADLRAFPDRLADPSFCEEMVSMTRSILYRESEALPRTELMELIALAVGGTALEDPRQDVHEALRHILSFVTETLRAQRSGSLPDATETLPQPEAGAYLAAPELTASQILRVSAGTLNGVPDDAGAKNQLLTPEHLATNDRLSRALLDGNTHRVHTAQTYPSQPPPASDTPLYPSQQVAADTEKAEVDELGNSQAVSAFPAVPAAVPAAPQRFPAPPSASRSPESFFRRAYWLPGVFALILAAMAMWLLQRPSHTKNADLPPAPIRTSKPAGASPPKPSAYGEPLSHRSRSGRTTGADAETYATTTTTPGQSSPTPSSDVALATVPKQRTPFRLRLAPATSLNVPSGREGVFLASSGMMASHLLSAPAPGYPKLASFAHIEGAVIVQVVVGRTGKVEATRVLDGPHLLRGAAEHAIRRWRYRPYVVDGKPTDVATIVTVSFRLQK